LLKEIIIAIQSFFEAHNFIRRHNLWKWILVPGIVYMILFVAGIYFFINSSDWAVNMLSNKLGITAWLQREANALLTFLFMMAAIMLRLILFFFYFSLFKFLFLIVGSPVFAYLSEKRERTFPLVFPNWEKTFGGVSVWPCEMRYGRRYICSLSYCSHWFHWSGG
jgi:CysZ protein